MITLIIVLSVILFIAFLFGLLMCAERDEHEDEEQMLFLENWASKRGGGSHKKESRKETKESGHVEHSEGAQEEQGTLP